MAVDEFTELASGPIPVELIEIDRLTVDHSYQRDLDQKFVEKIGTSWDWRLAGVIHVNQRNGSLKVVDGQHRVAGAVIAGVRALPCLMMSDKQAEEPRVFIKLQTDRRPAKAYDRHKAMLSIFDEKAVAIETALAAAGVSSGKTSNRTTTGSVRSVYTIYRIGGAGLVTDVFQVCRRAWPFTNLPEHTFLVGLATFIATDFGRSLDLERLTRNLANTTARGVVAAAADAMRAQNAVARELVKIYNRSVDGTRTGRANLSADAVEKSSKERTTFAMRTANALRANESGK